MNTWHYSYIEALGTPAEGCQTWQLNRSEDATAPCPQAQPLVRLSMYVQQACAWMGILYHSAWRQTETWSCSLLQGWASLPGWSPTRREKVMPPHHTTLSIPNTTCGLPSQERLNGHTSPGKHRRPQRCNYSCADKMEGRCHLPCPVPYSSGTSWVYRAEDGSPTGCKCRACQSHAQLEAYAFVSSACSQDSLVFTRLDKHHNSLQSHLCR